MRKIGEVLLVIIAIFFLLAVSFQSAAGTKPITDQLNVKTLIATPQSPLIIKNTNINDISFNDNADIYQYDNPGSVVYMYVTVRRGNPSDDSDHTWQEVNDFTKYFETDVFTNPPAKAEVILQIGDENGPLPGELGFGEIVPNATIQVRGSSTTRAKQKSYKIELFNRAGEWRGQSTIALNKHPYDLTRVRNKLCYDLVKQIPHMFSLRTQFVNLLVKDETTTVPDTAFRDYGLFTQVEQPNKKYLENHLLDRNGQLYKATNFEFFRHTDQIRLADDPLFNEPAFSRILEIKGNRDHSKLIEMLDKVNDWAIPIEQTFEKYFDADNYFTWMAFNILIGNIDTQSQNFYLYSPQNGEKWYFISWDFDGALDRQARTHFNRTPDAEWHSGISNYWGVVLHQRVLRVEKYRKILDERINELHALLSTDLIRQMLAVYQPIVDAYVRKMPDLLHLGGTPADHALAYSFIPAEIQLNFDLYQESIKKPMPFYLGIPEVIEDQIKFIWDEAYDLKAQNISYRFQVSTRLEFTNLIIDQTITNFSSILIPKLKPGAYFWRVIATNEDGKTQMGFDSYRDTNGVRHPGIKYFYIDSQGKVLEQPAQ